jgi:hypothetical protein
MFLLWLLGKIPKYTIVSKSIELNKKSSIYTSDPHHNYMISNLLRKCQGKSFGLQLFSGASANENLGAFPLRRNR